MGPPGRHIFVVLYSASQRPAMVVCSSRQCTIAAISCVRTTAFERRGISAVDQPTKKAAEVPQARAPLPVAASARGGLEPSTMDVKLESLAVVSPHRLSPFSQA
ncbi:hypothetical protein GY45DRAFT_1107742 [Cubamyces sp. BRFM 1775]|nr:hypothetical protein GY45DRAFT_1107742 [Cubamyces sp. BRFM 1775]